MDKKCKLICISENTKELFESSENLIDGTPCSYENSDNICIQVSRELSVKRIVDRFFKGVCQFLGCDGQLFSKVKTDMCGVCGGNNSNCSNIESIFRRKLKRGALASIILLGLLKVIDLLLQKLVELLSCREWQQEFN